MDGNPHLCGTTNFGLFIMSSTPNPTPCANVFSIVAGATKRRSLEADDKKRYLVTLWDGQTTLRRLVSKDCWDWIFRPFPAAIMLSALEPVPPSVQAEMAEFDGELIPSVMLTPANYINERAALAPGVPFSSPGEVAAYIAEYGLEIIDEYVGGKF